ncbi:hypothetical protein [Infirmifilum lucidum]|nr:hypothetical protein [Infirmifilum lucidum]
MSERKLKYVELSDEEVEEMVLKRLKEVKALLEEIKAIFKQAGVS